MLAQTLLLWPALAWALARGLGRPPVEVRVGLGPVLVDLGTWKLGALPGSFVRWADGRVPAAVGFGSHGLLLGLWTVAALVVDGDTLGAAASFWTRAATFRDPGFGGVWGGGSAAAARAAASPSGAVLAALAVHAGGNVLLEGIRRVGERFAAIHLLPVLWLLWLVRLDAC